MALLTILLEILKRPSVWDVLTELAMFTVPLWTAVIVGVLVGWAWKPKWANLGISSVCNDSANKVASPVAVESSSSITTFKSMRFQLPSCMSWVADNHIQIDSASAPPSLSSDCSSSQLEKETSSIVNDDDLEHLCKIVDEKDGGPAWIQMMDRSTPTMTYQAWRRDPETGPPQYRSRTVFEDATPEFVRDFFWDDEFRLKWDDMMLHAATLEECPTTGTMIVQWVRKFPFFCSDREYIIGRRIWESGRLYYCVTKGVPCSSVPRRNKPRRVDLYYSSWCIRAVESKRGDGQLSACEVLLFHHEDMGIPWEIAKLGIRQGMWGAVKKIDPGLRAYQKHRAAGGPLSRCAFMAQINTKVSSDYLRSLESNASYSSEVESDDSSKKPGGNIPRLLVVGGAIALACTLDRGLLTKAVIFGVARRFAKIGRRL
ncbi:uncharacterized protein LOC8288867 [Ricinus communis]|uniref:Phosphatidylcholine transfer protein, putative n=1 Tax=Ricinus communis TaxID=3988 RepID=B9RYW5_RICCO|nr:uncharacterized protein LOC8288867 [Ricinus communis]EEF43467.1 phosphatidylcholine transfer protein, putative [Ricinus communis]|eukprot:XP_002518934.1 uncharacterized protein LOC8288867 [Ricinus communis]